MTGTAIMLMVIALTLVWGGLVASSIFLQRHPQATGGWADDPEIDQDDTHIGTDIRDT